MDDEASPLLEARPRPRPHRRRALVASVVIASVVAALASSAGARMRARDLGGVRVELRVDAATCARDGL